LNNDGDPDHEIEIGCGGTEKKLLTYKAAGRSCDVCSVQKDKFSLSERKFCMTGATCDPEADAQLDGKLGDEHATCLDRTETSTTCCPPKFFWPLEKNSDTKTADMLQQVSTIGTQEMALMGRVNKVSCFRGLFGVTNSCRSIFTLKLWKCNPNSCDNCKDANGVVSLTHVETGHRLASDSVGCQPWFTMVDTGFRILVGKIRAQLSADALAENICATRKKA
jgi:hypothetical protein